MPLRRRVDGWVSECQYSIQKLLLRLHKLMRNIDWTSLVAHNASLDLQRWCWRTLSNSTFFFVSPPLYTAVRNSHHHYVLARHRCHHSRHSRRHRRRYQGILLSQSPPPSRVVKVERFLDTENAALISMHYPEAQREVHFGTAPFGRGANERGEQQGEEEQAEDFLEGLGEGHQGSGDTGSAAAGAQELVGGASGAGGFAGERVSGLWRWVHCPCDGLLEALLWRALSFWPVVVGRLVGVGVGVWCRCYCWYFLLVLMLVLLVV